MLNPEQEAVANHLTGPALVIAGPGSGKTRTVVHRIARLIHKGVDPENITAVTFTKKAAGEMRERLVHLVGEETATKVFTATFHSLAYHVLKDNGTVRVLPAEQARKLIGEILEELQAPKKLTAKVAQGAFSRVKNSGGGRRELIALYTDFSPYIERAWDAYEAYKEEKRLLDFDDLLHQAVHELSNDPDLQARWQNRACFLIVDEYQDTNLVQFNLLRLLLTPEENLMAVGDPNQAIYAWRGADFRLILEFRKHFPNATVYKLHTNYRSHNGIVTAAKKVITHNTQREDLDLKALRDGELPTVIQAQSREDEALAVAEVVKRHLDQGTPPEEIAILLRSLAYSRPIEATLRRYRIPYTIVGGLSFWNRKEVQLYLHLLQAANGNPESTVEVLASLVPGMGPKKARKALETGKYPKEAEEALQLLQDLRAYAGERGEHLASAVQNTLHRHRKTLWPYLLELADGIEEAAWDRWANVEEAVSTLFAFAHHTPEGDLDTYLADILLQEEDPQDSGNGVRIMTLHASKGLEFTVVLLPFLVEGAFPSWRSAQNPATLEEERRLFYVGLTRAKEHAYLSYHLVGERGPTSSSRFVRETPATAIHYNPTIGYQGKETDTLTKLAELF